MLAAHRYLALLVIAAAVLAAVAGGAVFRSRREPGRIVQHLLALVQTLFVAQVAFGLLLLSDGLRSGDDLHYAYGAFALGAVLAPWLYAPSDPRRRLLWFAGTSLLAAALAVRAYMTA